MKHCTRLVAQVLALALLAGCAPVGPDYQRPSYELPQAFPGSASTPGASIQAADSRWAPSRLNPSVSVTPSQMPWATRFIRLLER